MFNRRVAAICGIALLVVARVGPLLVVSGQAAGAPVVFAEIPSPPAASELPVNPDARFLEAIHREALQIGRNDSDAMQFGYAICRALDEGQPWQQQEDAAVQAGLSQVGAHEFVVISVLRYCPQHQQ